MAAVLEGGKPDLAVEVALRDGTTMHLRPVRPEDREAVRRFFEQLSPNSLGLRFFGRPSLEWATNWATAVDPAHQLSLVAETGDPAEIVAQAAYVDCGEGRAEVAFVVADAWQGKGISTLLLGYLADSAAHHGITTLTATVLPHNHRMIEVFRESGFPVEVRSAAEGIEIELPASLSAAALERFEERDRLAAAAAVRSVLAPRSVVVVGASHRRGTVGGEIFHNLTAGGFQGQLYAVNRRGGVVEGHQAHRRVCEIPEPVDLGVIVVPAADVLEAAHDCAARGARALVVISAGFAETGEEGQRRQQELLDVCRRTGMRLVGPNCLGVLNTADPVRLNATFAPEPPRRGNIAFMSQSGGLGIAILEAAQRLNIGLSSFVSVGNKADLSGNDFLCFWEDDPATELALLYLESFGNPRKFARIAPRFARRKPLLAVKSGRSSAGVRATASHTGAMLAASDVTVDALFEQAGVIRTDTMQELMDVGSLLSAQPVPRGDRIAVVSNAGGPAILCADACQAAGGRLPEFPAELQRELAEQLTAGAAVSNPVDMVATATAEDYRRTLRALIEADVCDAVVVIFVPPLVTRAEDVAAAIREVVETEPGLPIAAVFMSAGGAPAALGSEKGRVPDFGFPEEAARAVALAARYGRWRARPRGRIPRFTDVQPDRAAAIISAGLASGAGWLGVSAASALLECYGLPVVASRSVPDADGAAAAAVELGLPVALKASAAGVVHKSDAGAVRLGLADPEAVRGAAVGVREALEAAGHRVEELIVQPMVPEEVEMILGVVHDPSFGPVLACGAGGTSVELLRDVAVRITPITDLDAGEMLRSLRTFPLLQGYRGRPPCDVAALEDALLRLSQMVESHAEIKELDINPLIALPRGALILDARVRVGVASPASAMPEL